MQNRLGKKTGAGWYRYSSAGAKAIDPFVENLICKEAHEKKITRKPVTITEIQRRLLLAMINEACKVIYEGIARSARDIDLILIHGYGFARWRGGLMYYADQLGASHILSELETLCKEDPVFWIPSQLIVECARTKKNFHSYKVLAD